MIKFFKKGVASLVMLASVLLVGLPVCAQGTDVGENVAKATVVNEVRFSNLNINQSQIYEGVDKDGNPYTVSIERVTKNNSSSNLLASLSASSMTSWKVSFTGVIINCHFYMDVTNNKVTDVYDYKVVTIGCSYSDPTLTKKSTYGKLNFETSSLEGIVNGTCWLKGTVTGSDNDINVSYSM